MEKYGADSSRIACADAGDFLDDANFDEQVANAAILKLFTLEQWIQSHVPKEGIDFVASESSLDDWDRLILNALRDINVKTYQSYHEMKFKNVIKFGFNELLSLKETYLIGKQGEPNPLVLMTYIVYQLTLMNAIIPHFCQYSWMHYVLPSLRKSSHCGFTLHEQLSSCGWPRVNEDQVDRVKASQFEYLVEVKHIFRLALDKAKMGGKGKKKGKADQPEKPIESCAVFVGLEYPEFQRKTLEIMGKYECKDGELVGDYMKEIRETIKGKEGGIACKFAAYTAEQVKNLGKDKAMQLQLPFSEVELLNTAKPFLFENMPSVKSITVMLNTDAGAQAIENSQQLREAAVPGKPSAIFF